MTAVFTDVGTWPDWREWSMILVIMGLIAEEFLLGLERREWMLSIFCLKKEMKVLQDELKSKDGMLAHTHIRIIFQMFIR